MTVMSETGALDLPPKGGSYERRFVREAFVREGFVREAFVREEWLPPLGGRL
jgi:hypothetical protein